MVMLVLMLVVVTAAAAVVVMMLMLVIVSAAAAVVMMFQLFHRSMPPVICIFPIIHEQMFICQHIKREKFN